MREGCPREGLSAGGVLLASWPFRGKPTMLHISLLWPLYVGPPSEGLSLVSHL